MSSLFTVATPAAWLLAAVLSCRLTRVRRSTALSWAASLWLCILLLDFVVRKKLFDLMAQAVDVMTLVAGSGGLWAMLRFVWEWYGDTILQVALACVLLGVGFALLWRRFRNSEASWGWVDRLSVRSVARSAGAAALGVVLLLTVFAQSWPVSRELVTKGALVAAPFDIVVVGLTAFDGDGYSPFARPAGPLPHLQMRRAAGRPPVAARALRLATWHRLACHPMLWPPRSRTLRLSCR